MYYLIVNKYTLSTHYVYEGIAPDLSLTSYFDQDAYEHVIIPNELLNYIQYIKVERINDNIVLYVTSEDKYNCEMEAWKQIRLTRNQLLQECDFYFLNDYPIRDMSKENVAYYRQRLRDIPQDYTSPFGVVWPEHPNNNLM